MEEFNPEAPQLKPFVQWATIKLKIIDDNGFAIQKGYELNVIKVKDGIIYALPNFEPS